MGRAFSVNGEAQGFAGYAGTTDYVSFILIGTALSNFIMSVFWGMGYSLKEEMDAGVLESNWLAPVFRPMLPIGHSLTNLSVTAITSSGMLALGALIFGFRVTGNVAAALLSVLPLLIGLYGFGFAFAGLVLIVREANTLVDVSSYLTQMFSGADFPVKALPRWLLPISLALPLTYGFDAVRGWLLHTQTLLPIKQEIILICVFMVVMIVFGLFAFRALEKRVRRKGTLGAY
jgi:ABC-2 type transport system permease protein